MFVYVYHVCMVDVCIKPVQLGVVFYIHFVFLEDEIVHKQMGKLHFVQIVP